MEVEDETAGANVVAFVAALGTVMSSNVQGVIVPFAFAGTMSTTSPTVYTSVEDETAPLNVTALAALGTVTSAKVQGVIVPLDAAGVRVLLLAVAGVILTPLPSAQT